MNALAGRVRNGHIEVDEPVPEGAEVVVFVPTEEGFVLDGVMAAELAARVAEVDARRSVPAEELFAELDHRRSRG